MSARPNPMRPERRRRQRWTMRKNGHVYTTMLVRLHVPQDMVTFLHDQAGWSETKSLRWLRSQAHELFDDWRALAVDENKQPTFINSDDAATIEADGYVVYEGID